MATTEITKDNFKTTIDKKGIVILDFWAEWCGPCKMFGPVFEAASEKHADVVFGKVDTEKEGALAAAFGIRSIPTVIAFRDGFGVFAQPGMLSKPMLEELIGKLQALDMAEVRKKFEETEKRIETGV